MQIDLRQRVRENFRLGLEDVAVPVLIAGHTDGEFSVSTATVFEKLANGDLLKLIRGAPGRIWAGDSLVHAEVTGCWVWTGCLDLVLRF